MESSPGKSSMGTDSGGLTQQDRISLDGEVVAEYLSIAHASRTLNISRRSISCAITGAQKTAGGYRWVEKETKEEQEEKA